MVPQRNTSGNGRNQAQVKSTPVVVLQLPVVRPANLVAELLPKLPASLVPGEALGLGNALVKSHLREATCTKSAFSLHRSHHAPRSQYAVTATSRSMVAAIVSCEGGAPPEEYDHCRRSRTPVLPRQ